MTDIPPSVLDALNPAFMAGLLTGFIQAADRAAEREDAQAAALFQRAVAIVHAHSRLDPDDVYAAKVRARQVASCEVQKQDRVPWPDETAPDDPGAWPRMRYLPFERT